MSHPATRFWHPVSDMASVDGHEVVFDRGEGIWLWDTAGKKYLDACAGLWYCNVGFGRAELAEAAARQMKALAATSSLAAPGTKPSTSTTSVAT